MKKFKNPHIKDKRFYNHEHDTVLSGSFFKSFYMFVNAWLRRKKITKEQSLAWFEKITPKKTSIKPVITWIGHASFLIQIGGVNILTDPIFGNASSFYPRFLPAGIEAHELPPIDFVLISHNHRDHMDRKSLLAVRNHQNMTVLVPQGDKQWFDNRAFERTYEFMWWKQHDVYPKNSLGKKIVFTFLPAAHWSQRGLFDKNKSLWGSWMIEYDGYSIYFGGDTCYAEHFAEIGSEFPFIDCALLPIGPCNPRHWVGHAHVDAHEAGQAFLDLGARSFFPMHWGTFPFGTDRFETPINGIKYWWSNNQDKLFAKELYLEKIGSPVVLQEKSILIPEGVFGNIKRK